MCCRNCVGLRDSRLRVEGQVEDLGFRVWGIGFGV